eukprot:IDg20657t1
MIGYDILNGQSGNGNLLPAEKRLALLLCPFWFRAKSYDRPLPYFGGIVPSNMPRHPVVLFADMEADNARRTFFRSPSKRRERSRFQKVTRHLRDSEFRRAFRLSRRSFY